MPQKRIFVAVDISPEARRAASEHIDFLKVPRPVARVGWERAEKLHLTLKFVGETDERRIPDAADAVKVVADCHRAFSATLAGCGVFPNARQPRILWLGVSSGAAEIVQIAAEIEVGLAHAIGCGREKRPHSPHLTIARIREPAKGGDLAERHLSARSTPVSFDVNELILYESRLSASGSTYHVLARCPLRSDA